MSQVQQVHKKSRRIQNQWNILLMEGIRPAPVEVGSSFSRLFTRWENSPDFFQLSTVSNVPKKNHWTIDWRGNHLHTKGVYSVRIVSKTELQHCSISSAAASSALQEEKFLRLLDPNL